MFSLLSGLLVLSLCGQSFEDGFEEGLTPWVVDEEIPMCFVLSEAAHNGNLGLRVIDESSELGSSVSTPRLAAQPGDFFRLRFLARTVSGRGIGAYLRFFDSQGERIQSTETRERSISIHHRSWRDYAIIAAAPEGAVEVEAWLHSYNEDRSVTDFDQLRLEPYTPVIAPPWEPSYKLTPQDPRLTDADVPGPDGLVYPDWRQAGINGGIPELAVLIGSETFAGLEGTDIAPLLNEAVVEIAALGGGVIELPPGEYYLDSSVVIDHSNVVIRGAGKGQTRLIFRDHIPYGEIRSRIWSRGAVLGPNGFYEIQANPKNLVRLSASVEGIQVALSELRDHWGNRFYLRFSGQNLLSKLGPGTHTIDAEVEYANGDVFSDQFTVSLSEVPQPGDRFLDEHAAIMVLGKGAIGPEILLAASADRGSRLLRLEPGHGIQEGDRLYIEAPATARWNELTGNVSPWGTFRSNQLEVVAVNGDSVTVSQPLRIDFPVEDGAFVQRLDVVEQVGIEHLTIEQEVFTRELVGPKIPETLWYPVEDLWTDGVTFNYVWNGWVRSVDIINAGRNPLYLTRSKFCEVRDVVADGSLFKGGGGTGYVGLERSFDCLVENITTRGMRHAPDLQWGAAGNVIRNSHFIGSDAQWHAGWTHENLFENNLIEQSASDLGQGTYGNAFFASGPSSTSHGPQGPRNVVYYNDAIAPKGGIIMLGGNEAWIIVHNRIAVEQGRGIYIKEKSFDHTFAHNTFVLPNCEDAAILIGAANCTGLEVYDNDIYGPVETVAKFSQGMGRLHRLEDNRILPYVESSLTEAPRPDPEVKSIFEWQRGQKQPAESL